ncbi:putative deoxyribonuclease TATDN3 isoform X2 [Narcine bancroftii]|uniref:putative deoxyribonuclease TATDN3 isoform X2 n=1 Tax=Narcine bancroftii TaxID=1343680 RepID=UPI0038310D3D
MSGFVDVHCHLAAQDFQTDIDEVIEQSKKAGILALVAVAENAGEFERLIELSEKYSGFVLPCLGVHPVQGNPPQEQHGASLEDLQDALPLIQKYKERLLGIGEFVKKLDLVALCLLNTFRSLSCHLQRFMHVGLDFTPRFASTEIQKNEQKNVFIKQIEIAKQLDLPLNVHSRSAGRPTINLLKEQGAQKVLLHAFDGKPSVAMEGVKAGFFFSIPPSIIRSEQQKLVKQLPLESICLETDSPALGPVKQIRNEPKNISISCQYIAQIKGLSVENVMEVTTQNAIKLFPKLQKCIRL